MLGVYEEYWLFIGDIKYIEKSKRELKECFEIEDQGTMKDYVGCHITRDREEVLKMSKTDMINKIEKSFKDEFNDRVY